MRGVLSIDDTAVSNALQKHVMTMGRRYAEQQRHGRYNLYDGTGCGDEAWRKTKEVILNSVGHQRIVRDKYITNCPTIAVDLKAHRPDIASLKLAVRMQNNWDKDGKVIMNIVEPEEVFEEAADAEARVPPEEPVWSDYVAWDDASGGPLDPKRVTEGGKKTRDRLLPEHGRLRQSAVGGVLGEDRPRKVEGTMDRHRQRIQIQK